MRRFIVHLLQFQIIVNLLTFYVLIISILALLISIKIFDVDVKPELKVLKPIQSFNTHKISLLTIQDSLENFINNYPVLKQTLDTSGMWGHSILTYYCNYPEYHNYNNSEPLAAFDFIKPDIEIEEYTGYVNGDESYVFGVTDTFNNLVKITTDLKADRSDEEKFNQIGLLLNKALRYESNSIKKEDSNLLYLKGIDEMFCIRNNPAKELVKLNLKENISANALSSILLFNSSIYSCISICNYSGQVMEDINVTINDVFFYGHFSLFGWTQSANVKNIKQSLNSVQFTIDKLGAGQSIEALIKGKKYIRNNDIRLSYSGFSYIDRMQVLFYMLSVAVLEFILYSLFWFLKRKLNFFLTP